MQMHFLKERVGKLIGYLGALIYPESIPVTDFRYQKTDARFADIAGLDTSSWPQIHKNELWGGHREYYWFDTEVTIPQEFAGKVVVFELRTGAEGGWDATNPQFSIFLDGRRVQGLDVNHREIIISGKAAGGEKHRITLSAFTGDSNFHLRMDGALKVLDRAVEHYWYDLRVPYDTARLLPEEDPDHITIIKALNDSLNLLDLREEGSPAFYASLKEAQDFITKEFYEKRCDPKKTPVICCVGHTHIDCAWLWTLSVTRDKAVRSFSTVLELMRRYPEYRFMSSQPQLYEYVKENAPDVYEGIKERVREGRWEVEGSTWVEPDCNLPSGESLVRQFLLGKRFFRQEFGKDCEILWLPDVFGYSAALPQIMKKCGVKYFMTTKISWNETNEMPMDTFLWEGIDGTRILTHFIPTRDYNRAAQENGTETEHFTTYNGFLNPSQMKGAWARYGNKDLNDEVLCSFGFGDGGGGPTAEQLENQRRMAQGIPGLPRTKPSTAGEFFRQLERDVTGSRYLPAWRGELYLEYHRGTYTTMARGKRWNRKSEFAWQDEELLASMAALLAGAPYPQKEISDAWKVICRNQFHDILPGSAIREVYEDSKQEYASLFTSVRKLQDASLRAITEKAADAEGEKPALLVFNLNSGSVPGIVTFTCPEECKDAGSLVLLDSGGRVYPVQRTEEGCIAAVTDVPSKGFCVFSLQSSVHPEKKALLTATVRHMENQWFSIDFNGKGQFARIVDRRAGRNIFREGEAGNVIVSYEDRPHNYDAWDINNYYTEKSWEVDDVTAMDVVEEGPVRATVRIERTYLESKIVQYVSLYSSLPRIDIRNEIDWKQHQILLKDHFPIDVHTDEAVFEIQFGNVRRTTTDNTSWDWSKFEVCHHKWMDVSEDNYGVSILNDCKYGVSVRGTDVGMTMLKSPVYPNPAADREHHTFRYSIVPHTGSWRDAGIPAMAYDFNNPLRAVPVRLGGQKGTALPAPFSLVSVDQSHVIIDTVKKAEDSDDLIVRMYECFNRRSTVHLRCGVRITRAALCSMLEEEEKELPVKDNTISIPMHPYEIVTVKLHAERV